MTQMTYKQYHNWIKLQRLKAISEKKALNNCRLEEFPRWE